MNIGTTSRSISAGVQRLAGAPEPILVLTGPSLEIVWANNAAVRFLAGGSGGATGRLTLDRAMPAFRTLNGIWSGSRPGDAPIAELTFWTPTGVYTLTCRCRRSPFGLTRDALIVEFPVRQEAARERSEIAAERAFETPPAANDQTERSQRHDNSALREIARMIREGMATDVATLPVEPAAQRITAPTPAAPTETSAQIVPATAEHLARLSHEVRTPLSSILGFAEIMKDERFGPMGNDKYREYAADIHRSAAHALSLVTDLLDLSKLKAGWVDMRPEILDPRQLVSEVVATLQPQAGTAGISLLSPECGATAADTLRADPRALRQILLNLITNSIKCTAPGGAVIVTAARGSDGSVVLRVQDTGVGMTAEEIEEALRSDAPARRSKRRPGGSGIGLPLVRTLAEANGGILALSGVPGGGTLAVITFPPALSSKTDPSGNGEAEASV